VSLEKRDAVHRAEHERGSGERVGNHGGGRDDRRAADGPGTQPVAGIDQMMAVTTVGGGTLVVAGGAHGRIGDGELSQETVFTWMTDPDAPRLTAGSPTRQIQVAAGVDREVRERRQLAGREIDREAFGGRAPIEDHRPQQRDRALGRVDVNVAIGRLTRGRNRARGHFSGAVMPIEAARPEHLADGGIEGASTRLGYGHRKPDRLEQDVAHHHRSAALGGEAHRFAVGLEARARRLDLLDPVKGALDP
jgi:hypothetical protein